MHRCFKDLDIFGVKIGSALSEVRETAKTAGLFLRESDQWNDWYQADGNELAVSYESHERIALEPQARATGVWPTDPPSPHDLKVVFRVQGPQIHADGEVLVSQENSSAEVLKILGSPRGRQEATFSFSQPKGESLLFYEDDKKHIVQVLLSSNERVKWISLQRSPLPLFWGRS